MDTDRSADVPQSPETQPADVRKELDQENISKEGQPRRAKNAGPEPDSHFGAVEDDQSGQVDMTPVTPPMEGPGHLTHGNDDQSEDVDPHQEIPGG